MQAPGRQSSRLRRHRGRRAITEAEMSRTWITAALAVVAWISFPPAGHAEDEADQRFGIVHFATSCNETAQRRFDRGMRYQHSFWYRHSKEIFEETLKA